MRGFEAITRRLKAKPLVIGDRTVSYADFISTVHSGMTLPTADVVVTTYAAEIRAALDGDTAALHRRLDAAAAGPVDEVPYDNSFDGLVGVMCTDGRFPTRAAQWKAAVAAREKAAPHFGGSAVAWKDSNTLLTSDV